MMLHKIQWLHLFQLLFFLPFLISIKLLLPVPFHFDFLAINQLRRPKKFALHPAYRQKSSTKEYYSSLFYGYISVENKGNEWRHLYLAFFFCLACGKFTIRVVINSL